MSDSLHHRLVLGLVIVVSQILEQLLRHYQSDYLMVPIPFCLELHVLLIELGPIDPEPFPLPHFLLSAPSFPVFSLLFPFLCPLYPILFRFHRLLLLGVPHVQLVQLDHVPFLRAALQQPRLSPLKDQLLHLAQTLLSQHWVGQGLLQVVLDLCREAFQCECGGVFLLLGETFQG